MEFVHIIIVSKFKCSGCMIGLEHKFWIFEGSGGAQNNLKPIIYKMGQSVVIHQIWTQLIIQDILSFSLSWGSNLNHNANLLHLPFIKHSTSFSWQFEFLNFQFQYLTVMYWCRLLIISSCGDHMTLFGSRAC